ncbi:DNA/RNA non-specific endonuclease [uncultured Pseudokineococcus sp.]|uniref:DNA/RNA non-specific endonuclease n=1 Tax=uncultured Pseudokineococcus sp. TaxID=1642928 RepID=UPI00262C21FF|nr:DNA/RNA non-specific endonuclease [uncultured Pseudokineococcus sp.]
MDPRATPPAGYDPLFLGTSVPLPRRRGGGATDLVELPSTHFTVLLDRGRRLAAATAVVVDGARLRDLPRSGDWRPDPRVAPQDQAGEELYARNDLDRGHLVRRRDPVWGEPAEAARAEADTFTYPNAAPQASAFNQSKELWLGLEDHVLQAAEAGRRRLAVLTGPVLADDDPLYRGVQLPRLFWKVVAWAAPAPAGERLAAVAHVLDQTPQLGSVDLQAASARAALADEPPPLGPFRTFAVPVADVAELTGLDLGPLVGADVLVVPAGAGDPGGARSRWRELRSLDDVAVGRGPVP